MILHTLNASPSSAAFRDCLSTLQSGDELVLMGDGVYAALEGTAACEELRASGALIHLLHRDAAAAGVLPTAAEIDIINMEDFVTLTERYQRLLSWY